MLVPPDLEPGAVWLDDRGALCAVDGWDGAWCGDRWSAWAPLLHLPAQALHTVCMAFAKPPRLAVHTARLQAYAAGFVLRLLARASVAVGPHERVRALSRALLAADARRTLPERLLAADAGREGPSTVAVERSTVLAVMDRLVREPSVVDRERWLAVAGTALTAHHVSGTPGLEGWAAVAEEALAHLEPGLGPAVLPRGVKGSEAPDGRVVAWVAQSLRQAAGGWAPEGFDVAVAQLSWVPARKTGAQERLAAEVLALVAAERLGRGASPEVAARPPWPGRSWISGSPRRRSRSPRCCGTMLTPRRMRVRGGLSGCCCSRSRAGGDSISRLPSLRCCRRWTWPCRSDTAKKEA